MSSALKNRQILFGTACVLLLAKTYYWVAVFPNPDEAYYWLWGQFPDWSYHDHPGFQAWIQALFSHFGTSLFILRLPVLLANVFLILLFWKLFRKMKLQQPALILVSLLWSPLFFLFTTFAWNDYALLVNSSISLYFLSIFLNDVQLDKKGNTAHLYASSFFLGLAMLSKYNAVFVGLAYLILLLSKPKFRSLFKELRGYIAILIPLLLTFPIFLWNAQNKFGSFAFNIQQRTLQPLKEGSYMNGNYGGFLIGSLFMLSPIIWMGLVFLYRKPQKAPKKNSFKTVYTQLAWAIFLTSTTSFFVLALFSNVLYYWNILGLFFIAPLGIEQLIQRKMTWIHVLYSYVIVIGMLFHFGVVPLTSIFGGSDRDSVYHYGWPQIAKQIQQHRKHSSIPVIGSSYRNASLLAFALKEPSVYSISERFDQFDYWIKERPLPKGEVLILSDDRSPITTSITAQFQQLIPLDTIKINAFDYPVKTYYLHRAKK